MLKAWRQRSVRSSVQCSCLKRLHVGGHDCTEICSPYHCRAAASSGADGQGTSFAPSAKLLGVLPAQAAQDRRHLLQLLRHVPEVHSELQQQRLLLLHAGLSGYYPAGAASEADRALDCLGAGKPHASAALWSAEKRSLGDDLLVTHTPSLRAYWLASRSPRNAVSGRAASSAAAAPASSSSAAVRLACAHAALRASSLRRTLPNSVLTSSKNFLASAACT